MIPPRLNHYTILEPLGRGGMGEVFAAEDTKLHRKVALKVLSGLMSSDPERRERFEREARAVAALNHPSIVTIHSVEEADGVPFLTMELVEGKPLSALLQPGGLPLDGLLRIGLGISDAMAAAHQRGITHRDLKPANVMVTPEGRVKVLDFGLAKLQEPAIDSDGVTHAVSKDLTGEGRIIGTVAYMSPEQAEGKTVDQRSDIFSLGVMLHEMATGERPFKGDTNISVMSSILRDTPSSITDLNPKMPAGLAKIIRRALAKDPLRRYQTATDLRNDLEDLKQDIDSGATASMAKPQPAAPRRGLLTGGRLWGLVALGVIGAAALVMWRAYGRSAAAPPLEFTLDQVSRLTDGGNAQLAAISPDGRYVVHIKTGEGKASLWVRQTVAASDVQIVAPEEVRYDGLTFSPDGNFVYYTVYGRLGGTAYLYRIPVLGGVGQKLVDDIDSRISFSPDASQFAFMRGDPAGGRNYLMAADADGTNVRRLSSMTASERFQLNAPAWSPDGATILASVQALKDVPHQAVAAVTVKTGEAQVVGGRWGITTDVDWMPDGRSFVVTAVDFAGQTPQVWQVTFPSGERRRITNDVNLYSGVSVSRDGSSIASVQFEASANIWIADVADPTKSVQVTSGRNRNDGANGMTWTKDNRLFFISRATGRLQVWSMDADGRNPRALTNDALPPLFVSAAPDGSFAAFQSPQANGMFLRRIAGDGGAAQNLTKGGGELQPVVSPDGRWVYHHSLPSGYPRAYKIPSTGGEAIPLGDGYFRPVAVSPDGEQLVGIGWDADARRSSYATLPTAGGLPTLLRIPVSGQPAWSPDSKSLTYVAGRNGVSNILQRMPDGKDKPLTHFTSDNIFSFTWSPDGRRIAVSRGPITSDVVVLTRANAPAR